MRRIICFVTIISYTMLALFSSPVYSGASTGGSASMKIELDSSTILSNNPRIYFGFTTDNVVGGEITPLTTNLVLTKTYSNATSFIASGTAYAFFRIASSQNLSFSLSWGNLAYRNTSKTLYIYDEEGKTISSGDTIYSFIPSGDAVVDQRIELKFSTGTSAIRTTVNLSSTVTLTVKVDS